METPWFDHYLDSTPLQLNYTELFSTPYIRALPRRNHISQGGSSNHLPRPVFLIAFSIRFHLFRHQLLLLFISCRRSHRRLSLRPLAVQIALQKAEVGRARMPLLNSARLLALPPSNIAHVRLAPELPLAAITD